MVQIIESSAIKQYALVFVVNLSILSSGLGLAWPSPVLVKLVNSTETILSRPITEEEGSWIVSIGFLMATFCDILPALLLDRIGRKRCVLFALAPKIAAGLLLTLATEAWMLLLARAVSGACDGFLFGVVPVYAAEVASTTLRGSMGTVLQMMLSLGMVLMLSIGPYISYVTLNAVCTAVNVVTFIPLLFLPESPYYFYLKGNDDKAVKLLTSLRGSESLAREELKEYAITQTEEVSKCDLFKNRMFWKALGVATVVGSGSQLIGCTAVTFYLQTIFESTNTSVASETASVVIGVIQLVASIIAIIITDRFGRKPILYVTMFGTILGMVGLGVFFKIQESGDTITGFLNYLPLISLILVEICYNAGIGSLMWVITVEFFDGPARAFGFCISSILSMLFVFFMSKYFASLSSAIGASNTYWILTANCILYCVFIFFCVPETKGKSTSEIQEALGGKRSKVDEVECENATKFRGEISTISDKY